MSLCLPCACDDASQEQALNGSVHFLRPWFLEKVAELGSAAPLPLASLMLRRSIEGALNWELAETAPYTGVYFNEEIQGLADATGIPVSSFMTFLCLTAARPSASSRSTCSAS